MNEEKPAGKRNRIWYHTEDRADHFTWSAGDVQIYDADGNNITSQLAYDAPDPVPTPNGAVVHAMVDDGDDGEFVPWFLLSWDQQYLDVAAIFEDEMTGVPVFDAGDRQTAALVARAIRDEVGQWGIDVAELGQLPATGAVTMLRLAGRRFTLDVPLGQLPPGTTADGE